MHDSRLDPEVQVVRVEGEAFNRGLGTLQSPFVAFLRSDEHWPVGSLEERLRVLRQDPGLDFVQGLVGDKYDVCLGACLFRRRVFERLGPFAEGLGEDPELDYFLRLWEAGVSKVFLPVRCLEQSRPRVHPGERREPESARLKLRLVHAHFKRIQGNKPQSLDLSRYIGWDRPRHLDQGEFTRDWHTPWLNHWASWFTPLRGKQGLSVLELGSYEGRSALWFWTNLCSARDASLTCVDLFCEAEVEARFERNLAEALASGRLHKHKEHSHGWLARQSQPAYDLVYVDGSHRAADVLFDAMLSWRLLRPGGLLLLDDYLWEPSRDAVERPQLAIDVFLAARPEGLKLLYQGYQVLLSKE